MKLRLAAIAVLPFALAACDGAAMNDIRTGLGMQPPVEEQPEEPKGPPQPPAVSPLEQAIEVEGGAQVAVPTAQAETYRTEAFVARGNEPFWIVEASGSKAVYKTPDNQAGRSVDVRRIVFSNGVEYIGVLNGSAFALTIRGTDCVDDMSGEAFPMSATLKVGNRMTNGCAAPAAAAAAQSAAAEETPDQQG